MRTQPVTIVLTTVLLVVGLSIAPFAAFGPASGTVAAAEDFTVTDSDTTTINPDGSFDRLTLDATDSSFPVRYDGDPGAITVNGESPPAGLTLTAEADKTNETVRFLVEGEVATVNTLTDGEETFDINDTTIPARDTSNVQQVILEANVDLPNFTVSIDNATDPVTAGETATVNYTVENTGNASDTQDIVFSVNDTAVTNESLSLDPGQSDSGTFTYDTAEGDSPALEFAVASDQETATRTVTVQEPAFVDVTINETLTDDAAAQNDSVTVAADLENTGDVTATQDIILDFGDTTNAASQAVTLNGSETDTVELTAAVPSDASLGDTNATVRSEDTNANTTVDVRENAPFLNVSIINAPSEVTEGDDVTVDYEVENTGDVNDTQTIAFTVNGTQENTTDLTVANGSIETGSFTYTTGGDDIPSIDVGVESDDDADSRTVTVNEDAFFDVTIDAPANVTEGDDITVGYNVTNTGGVSDTQAISFKIDGTTEDTVADLQLAPGNVSEGNFTYTTSDADLPNVTAEVASDDDSVNRTIEIDEIGVLNVTIDEDASNLNVTEQENISVVADVENTGDVPLTQNITANVSSTTRNSTTVSLAGGETTEVPLEFAADLAFDGEDVTIASNDTTDSAQLTVLEVGELTVDIDKDASALDVNDEQNISVVANLTNTGDVDLERDVTASVNGTQEAIESNVTVPGNTTDTVPLTFPADAAFDGQDVRVDTGDDNETATLFVAEVGQLEVQNLDAPDGVNQSEEITVSADLNNTGETSLTQNVSLLVDGETANTTNVTVAAGSQQPVEFNYTVDADRQSNLTVAISSEDETPDAKNVSLIGLGKLTVDIDENSSSLNVTDEENISVAVNLTNTGEIDLTQNLTASVAGSDQTSQSVAVNGTNSTTTTLDFGADAAFDGETVTVASQDDTDAASLTVAAVGDLAVTIDESASNLSVTEDENVSVVATVENTGETELTQNITASVDGTTQDTVVNQPVAANTTETVTLGFAANLAFDGQAVTVASEDTNDTATLTIAEVGNLTVENFSAPTTVPQGERLTVSADLVNTGDVTLEENVTLLVDGESSSVRDNVSVQGNNQAPTTFEYLVPADRTDDVNISIATETDQGPTETVDVLEVGELNVSINETASDLDVTDEENISVVAEITNTGEAKLAQNITASVAGSDQRSQSVAVNGTNSTTTTLEFGAELAFDGENVTVASNDTNDTAPLTVVEAPFFEVTDLDPSDAQVVENESFTVSATITNTGAVSDTQTVELRLEPDGPAVATQEVSLNGSEARSIEFTDVSVADPGAYNHTVATADDRATGSLTVISATPDFELSGLNPADATVTEGDDPIDVDATVTNTGNQSGTQTVTLTVRNAADESVYSDTVDVALDRQTAQDVTFPAVPAGDLEPGEYTHEVSTANDTVTGSLTVEAAPVFEVEITKVTSPVTAGEDVTVDYTVENTGTVNGTQPVTFTVGETIIDSENITLAGGETTSGTFTYTTDNDDVPNIDVSVASDDETATETVTVNQPATPALTNLSIGEQGADATIDEDDNVSVTALLENTGDLEGEFTATLEIGNETVTATQNAMLAGGDSQTITFSGVTGDLEPDEYNVAVSVGDETVTGTLTVEETRVFFGGGGGSTDAPAFFEVTTLEPSDRTVTQGETFDASVTIENTGERADRQMVELRVDGETVASQELILGGDRQRTIELTDIGTGGLDAGDYDYGVYTEDDNQTATLTIEVPDDGTGDGGDDTGGDDTGGDDTGGDDTGGDDTGGDDTGGDDTGGDDTGGDDTGNESDTGEQTDDGTPGFGALVALVALIAAALLATRRND